MAVLGSIFLLFIVSISTIRTESLARTNSSDLCSRAPLQSCQHQLKHWRYKDNLDNVSREICLVGVANNTNQFYSCDNQVWDHQEICSSHDGCGIHLEVYRHVLLHSIPFYRTAFNLSLTNVSQSDVKIRYQDTLTNNFTFCINVTTNISAVQPFESLWYDCLFQSRQHESHPFQLEFLSGNQYGLFTFQVPTEKELRNGTGFIYVHLHHSPYLVITFQETLKDDIDSGRNYLTTVCRWVKDSCQIVLHQVVDLEDSNTYSSKFRNSVTVSLGRILISGNFSVNVEELKCTSDRCYYATSSFFVIQDSDGSSILLLSLLGGFIFLAFCIGLGCRKQIQTLLTGKPSPNPTTRPTILLVHDPSASDYCCVEAVQLFLQRWGGFNVWLDFNDIPLSPHKDPLIWYSSAMENADVVAVLAPPVGVSPLREQRSAIYHHTFNLALELMAARISRRAKLQERGFLSSFIVLETKGSAVPDVCSSFTKFYVPEQFPKLIRYISQNGNANKSERKCHLVDCLLDRYDSDYNSTVIESYQLIYEHLRQRNTNPNLGICDGLGQEDAKHVINEDSSLLEKEMEIKIQNRRRQDLDRAFGSVILSVNDLPNLD